ncbi:hypothetical protein OIV19_03435 [Brucella sp. HL-2]|nr:hypothetical protein [Brucella sp. HL-2]MCV9906668.1 hypothetical protein [Brucella sp. HL-2]
MNGFSKTGEMRAAFNACLRDESNHHRLDTPLGGSTGDFKADGSLCMFLLGAKNTSDPIVYFRTVARALMDVSVECPEQAAWADTCIFRIAAWIAPDEEDGDGSMCSDHRNKPDQSEGIMKNTVELSTETHVEIWSGVSSETGNTVWIVDMHFDGGIATIADYHTVEDARQAAQELRDQGTLVIWKGEF